MVVAQLSLGPYSGERLVLPMDREDPWERIMIPQLGAIAMQWWYLRAGRLDDSLWAYLFDDSFGGITSDERYTGSV